MKIRVAFVLLLAVGSALAADEPSIVAGGVQMDGIANLSEAEYEISRQGEGWEAPNRAQDFRTHFEADGIRLRPRIESAIDSASPWEWALSLAGFGRPGAVADVRPAKRRVDEHRNRIEYDRGDLVEWYFNDARGLEQGFTVAAPPSPDRGEVAIDLALKGTLQPSFSVDGQAIDFTDASGAAVLRYANLLVFDADGETLPARMEGSAAANRRVVRIVFDDRDAIYPVTVDPLVTTAAWTGESDQASAWYGYSVATAGDVNGDGYDDVLVGAYTASNGHYQGGRTYLYYGSLFGLPLPQVGRWTATRTSPTSAPRWQPRGTSTATATPM